MRVAKVGMAVLALVIVASVVVLLVYRNSERRADTLVTGEEIYRAASGTEEGAKDALTTFLRALSVGEYAAAAAMFGGDLDALRRMAPTADPADVAELLRASCVAAVRCEVPLAVELQEQNADATQFIFVATYSNAEELVGLGVYHGESGYRVLTLPLQP